MKKNILVFLFLLVFEVVSAQHSLFQYSTFAALAGGKYDGQLSVIKLLEEGNIGLGTFNALNGELIVLDGICYRAKADTSGGTQVEAVPVSEFTPFAVMAKWVADTAISLNEASLAKIDSIILNFIPANAICAFKLKAHFSNIRYRSVVKQRKPYVPLAEAVKSQRFFECYNVEGTLVGFYFPSFMKELNVQGFHWHFISSDKTKGGHLLDFDASNVKLETEFIYSYELQLPNNSVRGELYKPSEKEIELIEKGK